MNLEAISQHPAHSATTGNHESKGSLCAIFLYQQSRCSSHSGWSFKRHSLPPRSTIAWLTSELFWLLAAKADVLIDKGREGIFSLGIVRVGF